ncbi:MAG: ABC transporter permease [Desulfobacterales bacterium]|nr:ABC transporter permease [Desulfobacterales bacterium]
MNNSLHIPSLMHRLGSVWYRHYRVYRQNIFSNGIPPFLEPLFFLAGIGLGLGKYVGFIDDVPFLLFIAAGIAVPSAMFTASFECTFGTYIRLEYDKVYDGMISAPLKVTDLFVGEILFAATKGLFFSGAVTIVLAAFGLTAGPGFLFAPLIGFFTGALFASLSLLVTSVVKNINHFNFYFTGLLTPMFFFSGIIFPIENMPPVLRVVARILPLAHAVSLTRAGWFGSWKPELLLNMLYMASVTILLGAWAIRRLRRRLLG